MAHFLNRLIFFILLLSSLFVDQVYSIEVEGLYSANIKVVDQSKKIRNRALLNAFKEILVRKSGSREILSTYEVLQAYPKVTSYLQRYEYNHLEDIGQYLTGQETPEELKSLQANKFELLLDFEPRLIDELIQSAGMPIWGSNRPLTILWLAIEENYERVIVKETPETGSFSQVLSDNAVRRGVPLLLPLMDLEDQLNVNISDIWGRFTTPITKASKRYAANSIVTGRISQIDDLWKAKLSFVVDGSELSIELSAATTETLIAQLTDNIAELLCEKYCVVKAAERHQVLMQISNIKDFASYKKLEKYLSGLSSIRQVRVRQLSDNHIRLDISLLGELLAVKEALSLSNKLIEELKPEVDVFKVYAGAPVDTTAFKVYDNHLEQGKEITPSNIVEINPTEDSLASEIHVQDINETLDKPSTLYYRWVE
jgi:uncharacterized protein